MNQEKDMAERWRRLTKKQIACLDLILERKTSKEIARILKISKPTVDQRLASARVSLGTENRAQTALVYERLKQTYGRVTYDPAQVPTPLQVVAPFVSNEEADTDKGLEGSLAPASGPLVPVSLFKDFRRRDHSIYNRAIIMISLLAIMVVILLAGLGIAQSLTRLISG